MSNWTAYSLHDELRRLEPELALLRELGEAAKYWLSVEQASSGCPTLAASRRLAYGELQEAIVAYEEWEQDL